MRKYIIDGHTLLVSYDFPAIPMRDLDWSCVDDNYDGAPDAGPQIIGYGKTEQEAIEDWLEKYNEAKE